MFTTRQPRCTHFFFFLVLSEPRLARDIVPLNRLRVFIWPAHFSDASAACDAQVLHSLHPAAGTRPEPLLGYGLGRVTHAPHGRAAAVFTIASYLHGRRSPFITPSRRQLINCYSLCARAPYRKAKRAIAFPMNIARINGAPRNARNFCNSFRTPPR